jgi:hypothetical protein
MHGNREHVATGGLAHYGANYPDLFRRAGDYVDGALAPTPVLQATRTIPIEMANVAPGGCKA